MNIFDLEKLTVNEMFLTISMLCLELETECIKSSLHISSAWRISDKNNILVTNYDYNFSVLDLSWEEKGYHKSTIAYLKINELKSRLPFNITSVKGGEFNDLCINLRDNSNNELLIETFSNISNVDYESWRLIDRKNGSHTVAYINRIEYD